MLEYAQIAIGFVVGYVTTVALALVGTLGIASASPAFVLSHRRIRGPYKLLHEALWTVCAFAGGYTMAWVSGAARSWPQAVALAGILIIMLWRNTWEARQRGTAHQILISVLSALGVLGGVALRMRATP